MRPDARARQIAEGMLSGRLGAIETVHLLRPLCLDDKFPMILEDRNRIVGIDSETDHLPIGPVRKEWDPAALAEKDEEIKRCESLYGEHVKGICERILSRTQPIQ